jgi:hypothetical protein
MPTMAFVKKFRKEFEDHWMAKPPLKKWASGTGVGRHLAGPLGRWISSVSVVRRKVPSAAGGDARPDSRQTPALQKIMADVNLTVDGKKIRLRLGRC